MLHVGSTGFRDRAASLYRSWSQWPRKQRPLNQNRYSLVKRSSLAMRRNGGRFTEKTFRFATFLPQPGVASESPSREGLGVFLQGHWVIFVALNASQKTSKLDYWWGQTQMQKLVREAKKAAKRKISSSCPWSLICAPSHSYPTRQISINTRLVTLLPALRWD